MTAVLVGTNLKDSFMRFIELARVCTTDDSDTGMICYPEKMASEAVDFFRHRYDE